VARLSLRRRISGPPIDGSEASGNGGGGRFRRHGAAAVPKSFGPPGAPFDRTSPFVIGFYATIGVGVAYVLLRTVASIASTLILVGLAAFIAVGLEPLVSFQTRHRVPRALAIVAIVLAAVLVAAGIVAPAVVPVTHEIHELSKNIPIWRDQIKSGKGDVGHLAKQFHLNNYFSAPSEKKLTSTLASGALGAGKEVLSVLASIGIVIVLTIYILASLPSLKRFTVRLAPASRRPRTQLLLDEILARVGGFVLGNIFTSLVAGVGTLVWLEAFGLPYAILLALLVAVLDLIPVVGSTVGGAAVTGVALSHSVPLAIATAAFYVVYRFFEDYLLVPRVMRHTVNVSPLLTVLATLLGAAVLGVVGALVAIPIAAAIQLLVEEIALPKLDRS
jgi:predicted PurR-regulated permease PerM